MIVSYVENISLYFSARVCQISSFLYEAQVVWKLQKGLIRVIITSHQLNAHVRLCRWNCPSGIYLMCQNFAVFDSTKPIDCGVLKQTACLDPAYLNPSDTFSLGFTSSLWWNPDNSWGYFWVERKLVPLWDAFSVCLSVRLSKLAYREMFDISLCHTSMKWFFDNLRIFSSIIHE